MGFSDVPTNHLDLDMPQTPVNVMTVRVNAGWTQEEAAYMVRFPVAFWHRVEAGYEKLHDTTWRQFLELAGRRAFDAEPE